MPSSASPGRAVVSPLMPRSPSNLNAGHMPERGRSLAMRKSTLLKQSDKPKSPGSKPTADHDMAEQLNEDIGNKYVKGKKLGEGTYATVFQGHLRSDPTQLVAIKKFKVSPDQQAEGLGPDVIREIKYLQEIAHPSIVRMLDIFSSKDQNINMVMEFFPNGDLEQLMNDKDVNYGPSDVKAWMGMLCRAIYYCHSHFILHRDIKPNNLLIAADGEVKLADFGLARSFANPDHNMTPRVITVWYKPPELIFGAQHYGGAVDMWSIGMVFAQLLLRRPFAGPEITDEDVRRDGGDLKQIEAICQQVGTPTEDNWPGVSKLPWFCECSNQVPVRDKSFYMAVFPTVGPDGCDLLMKMLKLDPRDRISAKHALQQPYWQSEPRPTDRERLPKRGGGATAMGKDEAKAPGMLHDEDRFKGVARKLDFMGR